MKELELIADAPGTAGSRPYSPACQGPAIHLNQIASAGGIEKAIREEILPAQGERDLPGHRTRRLVQEYGFSGIQEVKIGARVIVSHGEPGGVHGSVDPSLCTRIGIIGHHPEGSHGVFPYSAGAVLLGPGIESHVKILVIHSEEIRLVDRTVGLHPVGGMGPAGQRGHIRDFRGSLSAQKGVLEAGIDAVS